MSNYILGISAYYHDSAVALLKDGEVVAAAQEERFSRKRHDSRFPKRALRFVLEHQGISVGELTSVVFYDQPLLKFGRILNGFLHHAPVAPLAFSEIGSVWLRKKLWIKSLLKRDLEYKGPIHSPTHHQSHAASAFFPSPFETAAFLTVDGVGEWETTTWGIGSGNKLDFLDRISYPHSLGLLYSAFTYFTGFKVNSGEYKVMGLAPYGEPKYVQKILDNVIDLKEDGSFRLNMDLFSFDLGRRMINERFESIFGRPARNPEGPLLQDDMDLARSIQDVTELALLRIAKFIRRETGATNLCLSGGVALNCVANGKIIKENIFERVWIQPAAGDAGGALGAALYHWHQTEGQVRAVNVRSDSQSGTLLGPEFSNEDVATYLNDLKIPHKYCPDVAEVAAGLLANGNIIGWFSGRMEFGPRALGSRSILGDARNPEMQKNMNLKIKFRESFRPFAPAVLRDQSQKWFDLEDESPYMLVVSGVKKEHHLPLTDEQLHLCGTQKLSAVRSTISAVTHVDYSARVQTVSAERNRPFFDLLEEFYRITNCPVLINTSFNVRGEPIVCTPEEAYRCFMRTNIDYLVLGNYVIQKSEQPHWAEGDEWKQEFVLD